ncbi:Integrase catalytic core, partial [Macrophomina phaseolina MS6]
MEAIKRPIVLSSSVQWDAWYILIKNRATTADIWEFVDPEQNEKPTQPTEPIIPPFPPNAEGSDLPTAEAMTAFNARMNVFNAKSRKYLDQKRALTDLNTLIHDTVAIHLQTYFQTVNDTHPWALIRALKLRLAPTDEARLLELETRFQELKKGPGSQDISKWIQSWQETYTKAKAVNLPEVTSSTRPVRDFALSIRDVDAWTSKEILHRLQKGEQLDFFETINQFHQMYKVENLRKPAKSPKHSAFNASFKGKDQEPPPCLCGQREYYSSCNYLNPDIRPAGWQPDPETQKKIDQQLKSPKRRAKVEKAIANWRTYKSKENKNATQESRIKEDSQQPEGVVLAAVTAQAYSATFMNPLHASWILDSGSDTHICNSSMKDRFNPETSAKPTDTIQCGNSTVQIQSFGQATINTNTPKGTSFIKLTKVTYVPSYMANLVSLSALEEKGVFFDHRQQRLERDGVTICNVQRINGLYYLEFNPTSQESAIRASAASAFAARATTLDIWHRTLAHAGPEPLLHLNEATTGALIHPQEADQPLNPHCDTCSFAKAHQIISKTTNKEEDSSRPFYRVSYDLIQFQPAYNGDRFVTHLECTACNFNLARTHRYKSDTTDVLRDLIHLIQTRFQGKITFFRTDNETSLDSDFHQFLANKGITLETSSPGTPAQNGHAERSGSVLITKARSMRIGANLPQNLWPEIVTAAAYLANRTPQRKINWMTPFQHVTQSKPDLSHLRVYGCKAFPLRKDIKRSHKLEERAHLGFLVGYNSRNIFRVWIPSQKRVVRSRDVTFDETAFYKPEELDLGHVIKEPLPELYDLPDAVQPATVEDLIINERGEQMHALPEPEASTTANKATIQQLPTPSQSTRSQSAQLPHHSQEPEQASEEGNQLPQTRLGPLIPVQYETAPAPGADPSNRAPRGDQISPHISPESIQPTRTRQSARGQAHAAKLNQLNQNPSNHNAFISAFMSATNRDHMPRPTPQLHRDNLPPEPKTFKELDTHQFGPQFKQAIQKQLLDLESRRTWTRVSKQNNLSLPLPLMWVFKYKFDEEGYLCSFKARICVRGDLQPTPEDTYAATFAASVFRALMAIVAAFNLETRQYDVLNAYIHAKLDNEVYCHPPDGMSIEHDKLLLLHQALYGLKQSPILWQRHFGKILVDLGLDPVPGIPCLYENQYLTLFFFVDDIVVIYNHSQSQAVTLFQDQLMQRVELRILGELQWFLAIRIIRDRVNRKLWLSQESYIAKLTAKFNVKTVSRATPLPNEEPITSFEGKASAQDILLYQQRVGSINFAATQTRPDVAHAASRLSEHLSNPSPQHLVLSQRVLEYLAHTKDFAICYDGNAQDDLQLFVPSSDASFASDPDTRQSHQGYLFSLYDGPIDWKAGKQRSVTTSSTEAEFLALSATAKQSIWWSRAFTAIGYSPGHETRIQ